jgi:transcription termination/antitermination protein NusG
MHSREVLKPGDLRPRQIDVSLGCGFAKDAVRTQRGEALRTDDATRTIEPTGQPSEHRGPHEQAAWYAIYTRSHFENLVADQLAARGFSPVLPQRSVWSKRFRASRAVPMFPGYLFIHHGMEKRSYVEILKARGVVRVLEGGWNRLTPIADCEMEAILRVVNAGAPVCPHMYFNEGDRVRVFDGPLTGLEGIFLRDKPTKGRLVVSISLLRSSVAVEVDSALVGPCE